MEQLKEEKKSETLNNTMKKRKKKGLSGTPTEPTDIKEMFARLPIEGKDVRNICYRTEDILVCFLSPNDWQGLTDYFVLARKVEGFEGFINEIVSIGLSVYDSEEWWCGRSRTTSAGIRKLIACSKKVFKSEERPRVIFETTGECKMFVEGLNIYLYTSQLCHLQGEYSWLSEKGLWGCSWNWLNMRKIETFFPDGRFVDFTLDETPDTYAELIYDSLRFSIRCSVSHNYAWVVEKETDFRITCRLKKEFGSEPYFFDCTRPNIEKAISIIESNSRPGKRYGIAAGAVDTPAQARARATKTAAKAKIKIARKKKK